MDICDFSTRRGRLIAPTADLSALAHIADKSAVGAINRPLRMQVK
ncbi:MAG TPA: hypothetical protein VKU38_19235 [Ktedonobacteraceae bacterium]|nr:hypothetical protein [Ktedonobacteraceae bacterium]